MTTFLNEKLKTDFQVRLAACLNEANILAAQVSIDSFQSMILQT